MQPPFQMVLSALAAALLALASPVAAQAVDGTSLDSLVGADFNQLVSERERTITGCETELSAGRWGSTCDTYRATSERVLARTNIGLTWCQSKMTDLAREAGGTAPKIRVPAACDQLMHYNFETPRLDALMRANNPQGAARADELIKQLQK